ncbi:MAG: response regulator [Chthoniobacter sp.]
MLKSEAPTLQAAGQRNQRILIIDDNAAIHDDVRKILGVPAREDADLDAEAADLFGGETDDLTTLEFEIDSAFQGQEGLAMVREALEKGRPYALAFVDIRMPPGWDGVETISRIWKLYPELQVVICTAYSDYSWEEMIREIGRTDNLVILKKPFDNVEVLQLAHTLTQKWTLNHQLRDHLTTLDQVVARRTAELQTANLRLREEMEEREQAQQKLVQSEARFAKAFQRARSRWLCSRLRLSASSMSMTPSSPCAACGGSKSSVARRANSNCAPTSTLTASYSPNCATGAPSGILIIRSSRAAADAANA